MGNPFATVPGFPEKGTPLEPIIYNLPLTAGTANISAETLVTAPATGTYRLTVLAEQVTLGASCASNTTVACNLVYTDPADAGFGQVNAAGTPGVLTWVSGDTFDSRWTGSIVVAGATYTIATVDSPTQITLTAPVSPTPQTNSPYSWHLAAQTVSAFATFTAATNNGALGNVALSAGNQSIVFRALAGTAIQLSTTYTAGSSCSPSPSLQLTPVIESLGQ